MFFRFIKTLLHWLSCTSLCPSVHKSVKTGRDVSHCRVLLIYCSVYCSLNKVSVHLSLLVTDVWLLLMIRRIDVCIHVCLYSWDESSSISSGLSDGSDNLSSEEFNTSPVLNSLPTTPIGSRRNSGVVVSDFNLSYKVYTEIHPNTACCMK